MSRSRAASAAISLTGREQSRDLVDVDEPVARPAAQQVAPGEPDLGDLPPPAAAVVDGAQADVADGLVADLAVDHVGADEHLARPRLERVEVDVPAAQPGAVAAELGDPVGVDEDPPPLALGDEADDARRLARGGRARRRCRGSGRSARHRRRAAAGASRGTRRSARRPWGQATRGPCSPGPRSSDPRMQVSGADLAQRVAVGDAAAPLGEGVVGERVGRRPSACWVPHQPNGIATTPGRSRSLTRTGSSTLGPVVPHAGPVAVGEAAGGGVGRRRARRTARPRPGRAWAARE